MLFETKEATDMDFVFDRSCRPPVWSRKEIRIWKSEPPYKGSGRNAQQQNAAT